MSVSFTGIANVGYTGNIGKYILGNSPKPVSAQIIKFDLNNTNGNDFDEFVSALGKKASEYLDGDTLCLCITDKKGRIYLNNKEVELNADNISLLHYLVTITEKISKLQSGADLPLDLQVCETKHKNTLLNRNITRLENFVQYPFPGDLLYEAHYWFIAKDGAAQMQRRIIEIIMGYFEQNNNIAGIIN